MRFWNCDNFSYPLIIDFIIMAVELANMFLLLEYLLTLTAVINLAFPFNAPPDVGSPKFAIIDAQTRQCLV